MLSPEFINFTAFQRFKLAKSLVKAFVLLHKEKMIHCDLHLTFQSFNQFLVDDDYTVLLADLDMTPVDKYPDDNANTLCRIAEWASGKNNKFIAPEQHLTEDEFKSKYNSNFKGGDVNKIFIGFIEYMICQ